MVQIEAELMETVQSMNKSWFMKISLAYIDLFIWGKSGGYVQMPEHCFGVPRQFVYDTSSTDISSTDISSTSVYQGTGQLYIQLLFQQIIIFINSNLYLHCDFHCQ